MTDEAVKRWDAHDLANALSQFIDDNVKANSLNHRWLAQYLIPIRDIARRVRSSEPDHAMNMAIREFRLEEIQNERAKQESEIERLDKETFKLMQQIAALRETPEDTDA